MAALACACAPAAAVQTPPPDWIRFEERQFGRLIAFWEARGDGRAERWNFEAPDRRDAGQLDNKTLARLHAVLQLDDRRWTAPDMACADLGMMDAPAYQLSWRVRGQSGRHQWSGGQVCPDQRFWQAGLDAAASELDRLLAGREPPR